MLITYNKKLKFETREKIKKFGITNTEVHSYHSFCVKYYNNKCYTDGEIRKITSNNKSKIKDINFDLLILDEVQDMNATYYNLICKVCYDNSTENIQICILGDQNQSIFKFNKADERFITFGEKLFDFEYDNFKNVNLSVSFRVTYPIVDFLNNCLLGYERLRANKPGDKVRYIITNTYGSKKKPPTRTFNEIEYYLNKGYNYEDIFVLSPSLKSERTGVRILSNWLSEKGIPVYVPVSDNENLDKDILKGKIVFSTFHQVKGLERKVVLIFNFDESYTKFYNQSCDSNKCPNEIYVAVTRASECLTVFHDIHQNYFKFLNVDELDEYCNVIEDGDLKIKSYKNKSKLKVSDISLTNHLPIDVVTKSLEYFVSVVAKKKEDQIKLRSKISNGQDKSFESVSDITSIAIPSYYEYIRTNRITKFEREGLKINDVEEIESENDDNYGFDSDSEDDEKKEEKDKNTELTIPKLLYLSNLWLCRKTGYKFKLKQIDSYNWLRRDQLEKCIKRMHKYIGKQCKFNLEYELEDYSEIDGKKLYGIFDIIDQKRCWMIKCLDKIENTHLIQLAIKAYAYSKLFDDFEDKEFVIMNILSGEIIRLSFDHDDLSEMVEYLFIQKYNTEQSMSDNKFLSDMKKIKNKYYE